MKPMLRAAAFCFMCGLVASACSSTVEDAAPVTTTTTTSAPTTTTTTVLEVVTTIRRVPAEELGSTGYVTVGGTQYDFAFECFAAGAGDILALGVGEVPGSEVSTQAVVQAFFGQPYVSVLIGDEQIIELAIDAPAELFVQSGEVRGSALRFVESTTDVGVGTSLGLGGVNVACNSFAPGLPDAYQAS